MCVYTLFQYNFFTVFIWISVLSMILVISIDLINIRNLNINIKLIFNV